MANVACSSIIVKAAPSVIESQESKEELDETRLTWLSEKCSQIQKYFLGLQEFSAERSGVAKQMALLRVLIQRQINLSVNRDIQSRSQALANSILQHEFVAFTHAALNSPDAQAHADCIIVELTCAFEEKNDLQALACIVNLEDLLLHSISPSRRIRQFPITGLTVQLLDNLYQAIQTGDYAKNPVTELYSFLQTISPQVLSAFCKRLQETLPSKLQALQDISAKLKILYGILIPLEGVQILPEIQTCVNQLVLEEGSKLMNDMVSQMNEEQDSSDCNSAEMLCSLKRYLCSLNLEDLLAQLVLHAPVLHEAYQHYLISRLTNELEAHVFREETILRYTTYKQFAEEKKLVMEDIPKNLSLELKKAFDQYLTTIFTGLEERGPSAAAIFREAKICITMKELFSISGSELPQNLFEKIKHILRKSFRKDPGETYWKEERELIGKLPLSALQKDSLIQALLTSPGELN